jgi:hypothetical protein
MMKQVKCVSILLLFAAMMTLIATGAAQTTKKKTKPAGKTASTQPSPVLEPKALEILKAASDRLASARTMEFTSIETYESPSRQGYPLVYATKDEVTLQRPDKLRVITLGDGPSSEYYYDGKTMTAFGPAENLVAIANAPPTIEAALEAAFHSSGTYFPFTDLIVPDPYKDMLPGLTLAYYVGQSHVVGNTTTDIVAFVGNGLSAEIWIGAQDKLPRVIHVIYLDDPAGLRHNLLLSDWKIDPAIPAGAFTCPGAASARRIPFAHPHPEPPPGAKPRVKGGASKGQ